MEQRHRRVVVTVGEPLITSGTRGVPIELSVDGCAEHLHAVGHVVGDDALPLAAKKGAMRDCAPPGEQVNQRM